jgi:hypothetical protein
MPHFYFHLAGSRTIEDNEGTPFSTVPEAIAHATAVAHELAKNRRAEVNGGEILVVDETRTRCVSHPANVCALATSRAQRVSWRICHFEDAISAYD